MATKAKILKSKEVAHILDCSPDDVYKAMRKGRVPAIRRGRFWLFRYEDVIAYKERREKSA